MISCANCSAPNQDGNEKCYSCKKPLIASQSLAGSKAPAAGTSAKAVKTTSAKGSVSASQSDFPVVSLPIAIGLMVASACVSVLLCYLMFIMPLNEQVATAEMNTAKAKLAMTTMADKVSSGSTSVGSGTARRARDGDPVAKAPGAASTNDSSY